MSLKHPDLISQLTLEEKAGLCSGENYWALKSVERLGIKGVAVSDGPHGLRKKSEDSNQNSLTSSVPAVCYPTAATTACSWDPELIYEMGRAVADECVKEKVSVLLGPGANMKRSPLCGRNFEYFSEDPFLAGRMASAFIDGVQSKGIGTSLKHFAANSQEKRRMSVSSVVDERALREIYLSAYEYAVKKSQPWTVMNAYNRVNGVYCSENDYLQNKILRDEWGFEGLVVSDWGAVNKRAAGLAAGNDLEMPSSGGVNDIKIVEAVKSGEMDESVLDKAVDRIIDLIIRSQPALASGGTADMEANHAMACKAACGSAVLLKNEGGILPLKKGAKVALIGDMAKNPRYQGAGSSQINPTRLDDAVFAMQDAGADCVFAQGWAPKGVEAVLLDGAKAVAKDADVVVIFAGLTPEYESEGYDRSTLALPDDQNRLISAVTEVNPNTVVVLSAGSPVVMPWKDEVKGILHMYLSGQAFGTAVAKLLTGEVNPSGKLAETLPERLEDNPSFGNFPGSRKTVEYRESVYIGYRYYDTAGVVPAYPFGYGLSYTEFEYSDLKLDKKSMKDTSELTVSFKVKNVGSVDGAETAQLYVSDTNSTIFRPAKELKGFKKVFLRAGEEKEIVLTLDKRSFAYYNVNIADWHVEGGNFDILIGASSRDIRLKGSVKLISSQPDVEVPDYSKTAPHYYTADIANVSDSEFEAVYGSALPARCRAEGEPLTLESTLEDAADTKAGKKFIGIILKGIDVFIKDENMKRMAVGTMLELPIRNMVSMSMGVCSEDMALALIDIFNGGGKASNMGKILKSLPSALKNIGTLLKSV